MDRLTGFISKQISSVSLDGSGFVEDCLKAVNGADFATADELPLERLVPALAKLVTKAEQGKASPSANSPKLVLKRPDGLAKRIVCPRNVFLASPAKLTLLADVPVLSSLQL